jgi:hypothetical protein
MHGESDLIETISIPPRSSHSYGKSPRRKCQYRYRCRDCKRTFRQLSRIKSHVRNHSAALQLPCKFSDNCTKSFTTASARNRHYRQCHTSDLAVDATVVSQPDACTPPTATAMATIATSSVSTQMIPFTLDPSSLHQVYPGPTYSAERNAGLDRVNSVVYSGIISTASIPHLIGQRVIMKTINPLQDIS